MKNIFKYFRKVRKDLLKLLAVAILFYVVIEFLNGFPEIFKGANKIGQFFSKISIAYVTSFIFYFIVVHIKNERDKENVGEYVAIKLSDIITSGHLFYMPFSKKSFHDLTPNDLKRAMLDSVKRNDPGTMYSSQSGTPYTWLETFEVLKQDTFEALNIIFSRYAHLDSKLVKLLSRVEDSMMYYQWKLLYTFPYDESFGMFHLQLQTYMVVIKELEEYTQQNYKNASIIRGEFLRTNVVLNSRDYMSSQF